MTKKWKVFLTAAVGCTLLTAGFAACRKQHVHAYTERVVLPTCTERGFTEHTCSCGESYTDGHTDMLGHEFTTYVWDDNATCEKDGTETAKCTRTGCEATDTRTVSDTKLESEIRFKSLTVNGNTASGTVANARETFSFADEVEIVGVADFFVSEDASGAQSYEGKTVSLAAGDNTFYVLETLDGRIVDTYTVRLRRRPLYLVSFETNGGEAVESQLVEEGCLATEPQARRTGYTFVAWDRDFDEPITENTTVTASWEAQTRSVTYDANGGYGLQSVGKTVTFDSEYTLEKPWRTGYTFCGWYEADTQLTDGNGRSLSVWHSESSMTVTAKWQVVEEMKNFTFTSTETTCTITGAIDKTATEIVVPDYVTSIEGGAFNGCASLESITLPFVGGSEKTKTDYYQYPLGYIFGTTEYEGGTATTQRYHTTSPIGSTPTTYYIPTSLKTVTVTGGEYLLYGAFYGCNTLENVVIPVTVTRIELCAFNGCNYLENVYYKGTAEDWAKISIAGVGTDSEMFVKPLLDATKYYYVENEADVPTDGGNYWHYDENGDIAVW